MVLERRPNEKGQFSVILKDSLEVGSAHVGVFKGPELVGRPNSKALNGDRACGGLHDCGGPDKEVFGLQLGSSPPALNFTEITNEPLMEEASRYTDCHPCSWFSLGK